MAAYQKPMYTPREQAQIDRQCPRCFTWFMTRTQRDAHVTKKHSN